VFNLRQIPFGSAEYKKAVELRTKVLREPLGLNFTAADFANDPNEIHIGAFSGEHLVGCLLLAPQGGSIVKMRQVAVAAAMQGHGVGKKLVLFAEELAAKKDFKEIVLNAREVVIPFYLKLGYEVFGERFEEVTIPHRKMRKLL
jgi:predicted GNAT family N-acyltransferase